MPITTDIELSASALRAGELLQEIQNYVGRNHKDAARVRFPRKFIRTAAEQRLRLNCVADADLCSNVAYTLILSDVQHWLLTRTDLSGTARDMIIKLQMFLLGSIAESILKACLKGKCGGAFTKKTQFRRDRARVSEKLRRDLNWVWEMRNRMHIHGVTGSEYDATHYTIANHNKAVRAVQQLLECLT
jgi:hypothetical protein